MARLLLWVALLTSPALRTAAVEMTAEAWRCASLNVAPPPSLNVSVAECACANSEERGFTWTSLDCSRLGFTSFLTNATLPMFVRRLDLSDNRLRSLDGSPFQHWNPLKELVLSSNGLRLISHSPLEGLTQLRTLVLSHNALPTLPPTLLSTQNQLLKLNIGFNNITSLPPALFDSVDKLDSLVLSHNIRLGEYVTQSPEALSHVLRNGLRYLEMNHINLSFIPANLFNEASELRQLYMSDNPFESVPDLYIGSLEVLSLSGSEVSVLKTGSFGGLPSLKTLLLDGLVKLTAVEEGAFVDLVSLRVLSMENCVQLHLFHGLAFGPPGGPVPPLRRVSLAQGGLHELSPELRPALGALRELELRGNPWRCDCNLAWLQQLNLTARERSRIRCYSPPALHAALLASLSPDQLVCSRPVSKVRSGLVIASTVLFSLMLMSVVVAVLDAVRRRRGRATKSVGRYQPIVVSLDTNRAELEWDNRDMAACKTISVTPGSTAS